MKEKLKLVSRRITPQLGLVTDYRARLETVGGNSAARWR